jgi:hypothetical protein
MARSWRSHLALPERFLQTVRQCSTAASLVLVSLVTPAARVQAAPQQALPPVCRQRLSKRTFTAPQRSASSFKAAW